MARDQRQFVRDLVQTVSTTDNGEIQAIRHFLYSESAQARARFIERCASMISAVAEIDALPPDLGNMTFTRVPK